jgi:predicted lipoprotein with Yx(FWY)xxD motif
MAREPRIAAGGWWLDGSSSRRQGRRAVRALTASLALAAAGGLIAACGSSSSSGASSGSATSHRTVVSVKSLPGIGTVLVDSAGMTLYSPQQEADGKIMCTGSCLSFWFPVQVTAGAALHAPAGVTGKLGTIRRADNGMTQLTINGRPLYTFRLDQAPGQDHGNNFTDHFGSNSFTWHAITTSGTPATSARKANPAPSYTAPAGGTGY